MKVDDKNPNLKRGKLGNLIYYVRNGRQYIRRDSITGKPRKDSGENRTPAQKQISSQFGAIQRYYAFFRRHVSDQIWRMAAKREQRQAANVFHQINAACFIGDGVLGDFKNFCFAYGELWLPRNMTVEQEGDRFRVRWEEDPERLLTGGDDLLQVGIIYGTLPEAPCLAAEVSGQRRDMQGWFTLDQPLEGTVHVYCFFSRQDETAFSKSCYFCLTYKPQLSL